MGRRVMGRCDLWLDRFNLSEDLGRVRSMPFFQSSGKYEWKRHAEKIWAKGVASRSRDH